MDDLKKIKWNELTSDKHAWLDNHFKIHSILEQEKTVSRFFTLEFSGTQQEVLALAESMGASIPAYVFDANKIKELEESNKVPFQHASKFFGSTNPDMDGKYGELLLYSLAERYLGTPLVSHKLSLLTNPNDQVKGGDGIFFGSYNDELAILIGESKIHKKPYGAMDDALDSLNRFHDIYGPSTLAHEVFIARSNISDNFSTLEQLDGLYKSFKPGTNEYKNCIKVHPVLLVFESASIGKIEQKAKNKNEAEELFDEWLKKKSEEITQKLAEKLNDYSELKKVYIDVFLLPLSNVSKFKHALYKEIHGIDYKKVKE